MKQSPDLENFLKTSIQKNVTIERKQQNQTIWHWLLLILFGLLTFGSLTQQLLLIGLFTLIAAIVKGPLMLVWGTIYSALVALFPPFALVLSLLFFIINLGTVMKSWRITLTSAYFYLVPLGFSLLKTTNWVSTPYFLTSLALLSILELHFILEWLYKNNSLGRLLTWQIISVPFSLLLIILPSRLTKGRFGKKRIPKKVKL